MIRLFIIEDHTTVIISSYRYLFRPGRDGIEISGYAGNVDEAIQKADPDTIDLFVLDLYIPGYQPVQNIRRLKQHFPGKPIAIYTSETASYWKKRMMDEGAITYITKNATREELKSALLKAAKGETLLYLSGKPDEGGHIIGASIHDRTSLSPLQYEIVELLKQGLSHKDISKQIGLSRSGIEKMLKELRTALQAKNNIELIDILTRSGTI